MLRCCRFDPLWNSLVVGGLDQNGKPFLGTVGMIGTAYTDDHVATGAPREGVCLRMRSISGCRQCGLLADLFPCAGFGNYLARPLFRERHTPDLSEADAIKLLQDALRVRLRTIPLLVDPRLF